MRIGIVSDAHGCIEGLDMALDILEEQGVDEVYFLGDAIGYFPGWEAVDRLVELSIPAVMGNHERMALDGTYSENDHIYRLGQTMEQSKERHLKFLKALPGIRSVESPAGRIDLMHGSPSDRISGYLYPDADLETIDADGASFLCMGHTHRPFIKTSNGCIFVNVGSCSIPRDGHMLGCVCILDAAQGHAELLRYDVSEAFRQAISRCGGVARPVEDLLLRRSTNQPVGTILS